MNISNNINGIKVSFNKTVNNSKKNKWKLSDSLSDSIREMAVEDAKQAVYMGDKYNNLVRNEVSKVSPDRGAAILKATQLMNQDADERARNAKEIEEADKKYLYMLFGLPYKASFEDGALGTGVHIFDENGDEFLTYTPNVGWHKRSTRDEIEVYDTMKMTYYEAYRKARKDCEMNVQSGLQSFDMKA